VTSVSLIDAEGVNDAGVLLLVNKSTTMRKLDMSADDERFPMELCERYALHVALEWQGGDRGRAE
jgi:hypothetical protein